MMKEIKNYYDALSKLTDEEFLTGNNFALNADLIYAEAISSKNFESLNKENLRYKYVDENIVIYSIKDFEIKENDVIFCKTDYLLELFSKLYQINNLHNLKLITHQAATPYIDKKLYEFKPNCISEWYSINIDFKEKGLFPIPLGIANNFSKPNLHAANFMDLYQNYKVVNKKNMLYCNFRTNTNPLRNSYLQLMENSSFCKITMPNLSKKEYLTDLTNYKYIFCPEGVGLDTHRFWEAMYAGSIPVAKKYLLHKKYEKYYQEFLFNKDIQIENYKDVSFDAELIKMLNVSFWMTKIKKRKISSNNKFYISEKNNDYKLSEKNLSKKYTRHKILQSNLRLFYKIKFLFQSVVNFNESLEKRFWYETTGN